MDYRFLRRCSVIQGDGMSLSKIRDVLEKMTDAGYTAQNCAFGMGGGLLQKVNRDTLSFATKLSHIRFADGTTKDIMKTPKGDSGKFSLPGELAVRLIHDIPTVVPALGVGPRDNLLHTYYDCRPREDIKWERFSDIRRHVNREWRYLPRKHDPISKSLKTKIQQHMEQQQSADATV